MDLSEILCHPLQPHLHESLQQLSDDPEDDILTPARRKKLFKVAHGRKVSSVSKHYPLPVDEEEIKRMNIEHRMLRFVYGGKNYVGPVNEILAPTRRRQRRILDCGTGSGLWACEMADEFPHAQVIGVDVAPIQPDEVPVNCSFEIYDVTQGQRLLPYESGFFDLVHLRSVHTGISDYAALLREVLRVLRPGGMVILAEIDMTPMSEAKLPIPSGPSGGAPGWCALWEEYRRCAVRRGIDVTLPTRLRSMLQYVGGFEKALLPIGFWNRGMSLIYSLLYSLGSENAQTIRLLLDPVLLTIGQLAWMNFDSLLVSLRPLLLEHSARQPGDVDQIIADAQADLYYPEVRPNVCLHIVHAIKL